jgi:hypothetical protein
MKNHAKMIKELPVDEEDLDEQPATPIMPNVVCSPMLSLPDHFL